METPLSAQLDASLRLHDERCRQIRRLLEDARQVAELAEELVAQASWELCLVRDDAERTRVVLCGKKFADTEELSRGFGNCALDVHPMATKCITTRLVPEDRATLLMRVLCGDRHPAREVWRARVDLGSLRRKKGSGSERAISWHPEEKADAGLLLDLRPGAEKGSLEIMHVRLAGSYMSDTPVAQAFRQYANRMQRALESAKSARTFVPMAPSERDRTEMSEARAHLLSEMDPEDPERAAKRRRTREPAPTEAVGQEGEEEDEGFLLHVASGNDCSDSLFSGHLVPWKLMTPELRSRLQRGPWTADTEEADAAEAAVLNALDDMRKQPGVREIAEKTSPEGLASRRIRAVLCQYSFV